MQTTVVAATAMAAAYYQIQQWRLPEKYLKTDQLIQLLNKAVLASSDRGVIHAIQDYKSELNTYSMKINSFINDLETFDLKLPDNKVRLLETLKKFIWHTLKNVLYHYLKKKMPY